MRLDSFTITTVYLALLGVVSQVSGDPVSMAVALSLAIATVALARKAKDEGEASYMMVSSALNFLFLPLLLQKLAESPLIRATLFVPASIFQLEEFLKSPRVAAPGREPREPVQRAEEERAVVPKVKTFEPLFEAADRREPMITFCPHCNRVLIGRPRYCDKCGRSLAVHSERHASEQASQ